MKRSAPFFFVILASLPTASFPAAAQQIAGVQVEPARPDVDQPVQVSIDLDVGTLPIGCGLKVDLGDGSVRELRADQTNMPITLTYRYPRPGQYVVSAVGSVYKRGLRTALACGGGVRRAVVEVTDLAAERARQVQIEQAENAKREAAAREARLAQERTQREAADREARAQSERLQREAAARRAKLDDEERAVRAREEEIQRHAAENARQLANREAEIRRREEEARIREEALAARERERSVKKEPPATVQRAPSPGPSSASGASKPPAAAPAVTPPAAPSAPAPAVAAKPPAQPAPSAPASKPAQRGTLDAF